MGGHGQGGVTILGAAGFLGQRLTRTLAARGVPLVLADRIAPPSPPAGAELVLGELQGTLLQDAIRDDTVAVVNLASVLSGGAEEDFDLGYEVNLLGLKATLERFYDVVDSDGDVAVLMPKPRKWLAQMLAGGAVYDW